MVALLGGSAMTAVATFYCDWCNRVRNSHSSGPVPGYEAVLVMQVTQLPIPSGWWSIPGSGGGAAVSHCCPECYLNPDGEARTEVTALLSRGTISLFHEEPMPSARLRPLRALLGGNDPNPPPSAVADG